MKLPQKGYRPEPLDLLEIARRARRMSPKDWKEFDEAFEAKKKEIVDKSLEADGWSKAPPDTRAYRALIFTLCAARDEKDNPVVQKALAVQATIDFLSESDFPSSLIKPLRDLVGDLIDISKRNRRTGKPGRTSMPHNEKVKATQAAAAVTLLRRKNGGVDSALKMVCKASGFEVKWLRQFRQNVLRGKGGDAQLFYKHALMYFEKASEAELLKALHSRVVSNPVFF